MATVFCSSLIRKTHWGHEFASVRLFVISKGSILKEKIEKDSRSS